MHSHRRKRGFTLAETLIVVAIITILGGVAFIAVIRYLRTMAQLERDGIAKEIFVSAQNHLTMAEGQGYLGKTGYGTEERKDTGVYYFVVNGNGSFTGESVLDLMLPFGSVDESVRIGGSYIVRYQLQPALVLDVFYCTPGGTRFGHTLSAGNYTEVMGLRDTDGGSRKADRRNWGDDRAVLGWYGGEQAQLLQKGQELKTPELEVINAEKLIVRVKDPNTSNTDASLRLIITGEVSGQKEYYDLLFGSREPNITDDNGLVRTYTVILDDVTSPGLHFHELLASFLPGENLRLQAVAFSNKVLTNIAETSVRRTNSLFGAISAGGGSGGSADPRASGPEEAQEVVSGSGLTARINNIRHLENLAATTSGVNVSGELQIANALQTTDLDWADFRTRVSEGTETGAESVRIYETGSSSGTEAGCYLPVNTVYGGGSPGSWPLDYDGQGHRISGIKVNCSGDAGVFGTLESGSRINGLMLVDSDITSTGGSAGALAGSLKNAEVTNVLAQGAAAKVSVTGGSGSAGGLAGSAEGGTFTACGAALKVSTSASGDRANAGGLIGTASGAVDVSGCYAAGHTQEGKYTGIAEDADVCALSGRAGGLIGDAGSSTVRGSYSTCSVTGATAAGGFAGRAAGTFENCYATGLVRTAGLSGTGPNGSAGGADPAVAGAFAGAFTGSAKECRYIECINEILEEDGFSIRGLPAAGGRDGSVTIAGITPADSDADTYTAFCGSPENRQEAGAYDGTLIRYYQGKYSFQTVTQLDAGLDPRKEFFIDIHYGDWPAPELMIRNTRQ